MKKAEETGRTFYEPIFVARQPVFDREQDIFAYELLFRHSAAAKTADFGDADTATSKVIADGFGMALEAMTEPKRMLVNFPEQLLLTEAALALPKDLCIIEILENVRPLPEVIAACKALKDAGYLLALDDFIGQPGVEELLSLADIIKVDILGMTTPEIIKIAQRLRPYKAALLAEKIENDQIHRLARTLGFKYFQGYFFSRPEVMEGRKLPTGVAAKVQLLRSLADPEYQVSEVAKIIARDTGLSYRMLKYLNSAAFYLRHEVTSISQAVVILGQKPLKQWLMAVVLSDMASTPRTEELAYQSLQRARFLETLSTAMPKPPLTVDGMFLLGLFSRLDALLGMHMEQVSEELPLDHKLVAALCGEQNDAWRALHLVESLENGRWKRVDATLRTFAVPVETSAIKYCEASTWAKEILGSAS